MGLRWSQGRFLGEFIEAVDLTLLTRSSDAAKPVCTTAYFIDNYAMFTCGNGNGVDMVSAFYHATSVGAIRSMTQESSQSPEPSSSSGQSTKTGSNDTSTPVGPIVGGVVGGVGVVIIGFVLVWRTKRKGKKPPSSGSVVELTRPPTTGQSQTTVSDDNKDAGHAYAEMEVPHTVSEMPLGRAHYAHEVGGQPGDASKGRMELVGSERKVYAELDGERR